MNPYKILDLDPGASKRDIIQAAATAMRKKEYTGKEVAEAQRELMNPISRAAHEFIDLMDVVPFLNQLDVKVPETSNGDPLNPLSASRERQ